MKKRKSTIVVAIVFLGLIIAGLVGCRREKSTMSMLSETVIIHDNMAYLSQGIIQIDNGPIRFTSADSGESVVLCDKPDCRHEPPSRNNPNPSCLAQILGVRTFVIYQGRQLFICDTDGSPMTVSVYTADVNGTNRKMLTQLENVQFIRHVMIQGDTLAIAYTNNYTRDEIGLLEPLKKPEVGLAVVNLSTGRTDMLQIKSGYAADIKLLSMESGLVTYCFKAQDEEMSNREAYVKGGEELAQWLEQVSAHTTHTLYSYNISTRKETIVLQYKDGPDLQGVIGSYAVGSHIGGNELRLVPLDGGESFIFAKPTAGQLNGILTIRGIEDGVVYYSDYNYQDGMLRYYQYDPIKGRSVCLNKNKDTSFVVTAILPDIVYGSLQSDELFYAALSKQDFLNGNFDKIKILVYPNRKWNEDEIDGTETAGSTIGK